MYGVLFIREKIKNDSYFSYLYNEITTTRHAQHNMNTQDRFRNVLCMCSGTNNFEQAISEWKLSKEGALPMDICICSSRMKIPFFIVNEKRGTMLSICFKCKAKHFSNDSEVKCVRCSSPNVLEGKELCSLCTKKKEVEDNTRICLDCKGHFFTMKDDVLCSDCYSKKYMRCCASCGKHKILNNEPGWMDKCKECFIQSKIRKCVTCDKKLGTTTPSHCIKCYSCYNAVAKRDK